MLGITDDNNIKKNKGKRKRRGVTFNDEECIINPEDVDPNVGRFRNLIQTTIVPTKRARFDSNLINYPSTSTSSDITKHLHPMSFLPNLYQDLPPISDSSSGSNSSKIHNLNSGNSYNLDVDMTSTLGSKLGLLLPNPAPEVTSITNEAAASVVTFGVQQGMFISFFFFLLD